MVDHSLNVQQELEPGSNNEVNFWFILMNVDVLLGYP